ncbi:hypothetical protein LCGC14_2767070 [marine sediment metagenome]|uniref:Uncharacterized protein n=1 Tax=marine sediment metagenome TaxID=412755 RepID=A0A0F9BNX4_9ZZZZ
MVKFDRTSVQSLVTPGEAVEITISGYLFDGSSFQGIDTLRVIDKGAEHNDDQDPSSIE